MNIFWALWNDILNGLTIVNFEEIDTLSFTGIAIFILLIYYIFSKDRALNSKFLALEKKLQVMLEQKFLEFIDDSEQQRDKLKSWQQELEETLEKRIRQLIDQIEQQGDRDRIWKQSLEDNLLKLANQNKAEAAISELQHKEKLRLWKQGLEQKIQVIMEQHEQQKEKIKSWQCSLEGTLELKTQEIIDQNKRQKDENEGGRQELERMLEQNIQQLTGHTEQQRESNEVWKQDLENNFLKLINQKIMDSKLLEVQYKEKFKVWKQSLEQRIQELKEQGERQKERYEAWVQTLREEIKITTKEKTQVETEDKIRESQPKVIRKQTLVYPVSVQQRPPDDDHPQGYEEFEWQPMDVLELRKFKESVTNFGMHSPFVKQILISWAIKNRVIPQDWKDMVRAILEPAENLQWISWWREEVREIARQNRARGRDISTDQLLGEGRFAEVEVQAVYDEETLAWCRLSALKAWDKVAESGKRLETFTQVIQGPKETFPDFLQRLTSAVERSVSDSAARKAIIESLAFENANTKCRELIRPLKARSAPIDEWIRYTADVGSCSPDMTVIGEAATGQLEMTQDFKCFNCGEQGHLRYYCKKNQSNTKRGTMPPGICQRCGRGGHLTKECRAITDRWGRILPKNSQGGLSQAPMPGRESSLPQNN